MASTRMVYSVPLVIFQDDVSGNRSKQWNKHYLCYLSNGTIPCQKLESEFHVRFVATSPFASPLEIMQGIRLSIETAFASPIVACDCQDKAEVLLRPYALLFPGDNPMQAEFCSSAGLCCNHFCRTCRVGGNQKHKQSDEGFSELFKPAVSTTLVEAVRSSGTKDTLAQPVIDNLVKLGQQLRKNNPERAAYTLDELRVDIHKDTLTEILHTILLGTLNSIVTDGLNVPKLQADYMCQYKGVMAFAVYDIVPKEVLEAWLIIHTEIKDIESYTQKDLDSCINDFLNITCKCSPSILITKPKFHFLVHLSFYIRRFGPALLFSTERYEAYNTVFRAASYSELIVLNILSLVGGGWIFEQTVDSASQKVLTHILNTLNTHLWWAFPQNSHTCQVNSVSMTTLNAY
ncbi:hypothetical protein BJV74DRAFT_879922 [Russula compacta]|nr:hypothetical protein BJV74DRAFT_879922 [Russula compacta]